jgi:hypothetical protein
MPVRRPIPVQALVVVRLGLLAPADVGARLTLPGWSGTGSGGMVIGSPREVIGVRAGPRKHRRRDPLQRPRVRGCRRITYRTWRALPEQ